MEILAKSTHSEGRAKEFFRFHLLRRSVSRYVYFALALILFITAAVFAFLRNSDFALFFLFMAVIILIMRIVTINLMLKKIMKNTRFPSISYTLRFTYDNIEYQVDTYKKKYQWDEILGVYETLNFIYFYISPNSALILMKYILPAKDRDELTKLIINSKVKYVKNKFK